MDEVWARAAIVLGVLLVAFGMIALLRRRRRPIRAIEAPDLGAGIFFFSSVTCPTCARARAKLDAHLGESGYTEFAWESDADLFTKLNVDAVPAVAVLDQTGSGKLYPGQPDRALARL